MNQHNHYINIYKLKKELYYYPSWYEDKSLFFKLLKQSNFTDEDILNFGRIYVSYSHINNSKELTKYFNYILKKMKLNDSKTLFQKTNAIYNTKQIKSRRRII